MSAVLASREILKWVEEKDQDSDNAFEDDPDDDFSGDEGDDQDIEVQSEHSDDSSLSSSSEYDQSMLQNQEDIFLSKDGKIEWSGSRVNAAQGRRSKRNEVWLLGIQKLTFHPIR